MLPGMPPKARAEHDGQIDDIGTGQKVTEREGFVEFVRRHPAMLIDDGAPCPNENPAEARERHLGERHEQLDQIPAGRATTHLGAGGARARYPEPWHDFEWPPPQANRYSNGPRICRAQPARKRCGFSRKRPGLSPNCPEPGLFS